MLSSACQFLFPKLRAFLIHFFVTLAVASLSGILVFYIWYPWPFYEITGGLGLFSLVVACDVVLGPIVSFVIFSKQKTRRVLFIDYAFVAVFQIFAFVFGFYAVIVSRPVFVVFAVDAFEVVAADEILDADLEVAAHGAWKARGFLGPKLVWAKMPDDPVVKSQLIFDALSGKDIQRQPKFYVPYSKACPYVLSRGGSVSDLNPDALKAFYAAERTGYLNGLSVDDVVWAPVRSDRATWTAILRKSDCVPVAWLNADPY